MSLLKINYISLSLILIYSFLSPLNAQSNSESSENNLEASDIWPKSLDAKYYNETWNYYFDFNDGTKLFIEFSVSEFGRFKSAVSGARISLHGFDETGNVYRVSREYPIEDLEMDQDEFKLNLNPRQDNIWFKGKLPEEHHLHIDTGKDGVRFDIDLSLHNIQHGEIVNGGVFMVAADSVGIITHIPFAEVTGQITMNQKKRVVKGTAQMDRVYMSNKITDILHAGYRFASLQDPSNWLSVILLQPNSMSQNMIGYILRREEGQISTEIVKSATVHESTQSVSAITITSMNNNYELINNSIIERYGIFSELSWLARRAARIALGGELIIFRGDATFSGTDIDGSDGYYNFFLID